MATMWVPTDQIKPYWTLGVAFIGESVHAPDSIFVYYYVTAVERDPPEGIADHGIYIEPLDPPKRPRAMFEMGPWLRNRRVLNLGDWLEERYPLMTCNFTAEELAIPRAVKRKFSQNLLTICPFIWLLPEVIRTAWEDIRLFAMREWQELMFFDRDTLIQTTQIQVFRRPSFW